MHEFGESKLPRAYKPDHIDPADVDWVRTVPDWPWRDRATRPACVSRNGVRDHELFEAFIAQIRAQGEKLRGTHYLTVGDWRYWTEELAVKETREILREPASAPIWREPEHFEVPEGFDPRAYVKRAPWVFAKTMAHIPHEYTREGQTPYHDFWSFYNLIQRDGYLARWKSNSPNRYLELDNYKYWCLWGRDRSGRPRIMIINREQPPYQPLTKVT